MGKERYVILCIAALLLILASAPANAPEIVEMKMDSDEAPRLSKMGTVAYTPHAPAQALLSELVFSLFVSRKLIAASQDKTY